ncbi:retrovirus-related pol polyprotein from transposon TNT 1-94, partial [Tanacetum coccineum]
MLAPGNYVQWNSRIKRYIDTKPNSELIHYCLQNPPYTYQWAEKTVLVVEGSSETTTKRSFLQDNNDIYTTVDSCPMHVKCGTPFEGLKTRSQHSTRNRGKAIVTSSAPTYDPETDTVTEDEEMSKEKEIDKLMALISLSFKKIYKPTNNNLRTSSNTSITNQDNSLRINRGIGYDNQRVVNVARARVVEQADWKDDTDDESNNQELEAHYMYMVQIQEVTPDPVDNSGPIFNDEPMHKIQNNNDNYNVFAMENEHPVQPESSNDIYLTEQSDTNITIDSLDICYDRVQDDQDDTDDLDQERDLLASLIQKLKCEIDDNKNRNKFLESSNKALVDKLKDLKKFQAELDKYNNVNYASKVEIDCAKAKGDLMSYKIDFEKSSNAYTQQINDLNQTISDMKKELCAHQETISIMSQAKEAQIKLYKTREDKELDKVIALENKVKVLNDIVYKTGQSVQTMNMLNRNCKTSFAKPEFLKKAQRANPRLYDIGCYNDNLALMLAPESDETIRLDKESRSKLSDLIKLFDYDKLNNLYDLKCVLNGNHDLCVLHYINGVNSRTRQLMVVPISTREPKHNVNQSVATSSRKTVAADSTIKKSRHITRKLYEQLVEIILFIVDSGCSKHMTRNLKLLTNFVEKFLGTVKFGNDQIALILGYGDLVQGTITIKRGNDLLTHSRGTDLYSITLQDSTSPNPICLMAKATSSQAWLWHRRLSHLNFDTINLLSKNNIVNGLPKLKFVKDHLCSSCELGKAKRKDGENLDKMKEKADACIFVGYSTQSKSYRVFNKRTIIIVETIHVNFDELPQMASDHISSDLVAETVTTSNELELLYSLMFSELLNGTSHVVSKSSAVHAADNPDKRQQHNTTHSSTTTDVADPPPLNIQSTHQTPTQVPTVTAPENIIQAETNTENAQFDKDEFINIFSTPVQEQEECDNHGLS